MFLTPTDPTDRDLRWFGGLGMLFTWGMAAWLIRQHGLDGWTIGLLLVGLLCGLVAFVQPRLLRTGYIGWMWAVSPIGRLVGCLLLGVVYFGVLTPVGWGLRLIGHDPLTRRPDPHATSFWRPRTRQRQAADYFRQS